MAEYERFDELRSFLRHEGDGLISTYSFLSPVPY